MQIPKKIGKYEVLSKIGEGGFGIVYKGRDPFIKRLVAIKTCNSANEAVQERFFREAEIAGNLHHANVVTIHDFGVDRDTPYLVQEFLVGQDLDTLLQDPGQQVPLAYKVRVLRDVALGLEYAHENGVVHRDIKPANVRVLDDGRAKVMDFGIAKLKGATSNLTQTGTTIGTIAYLSPEQVENVEVDQRSDIFSYGILAYEALAGRRPFGGDQISTIFYQLLHQKPAPLDGAGLPDELRRLVEKCLEKKPDNRFQTFTAILGALDEIAAELPTADTIRLRTTPDTLEVRVNEALDRGDLEGAGRTLAMAAQQLGATDYERRFGPLQAQLAKQAHGSSLNTDDRDELAAGLEQIESLLARGRNDEAAMLGASLAQRFPSSAAVQTLRSRIENTASDQHTSLVRCADLDSGDLDSGDSAGSAGVQHPSFPRTAMIEGASVESASVESASAESASVENSRNDTRAQTLLDTSSSGSPFPVRRWLVIGAVLALVAIAAIGLVWKLRSNVARAPGPLLSATQRPQEALSWLGGADALLPEATAYQLDTPAENRSELSQGAESAGQRGGSTAARERPAPVSTEASNDLPNEPVAAAAGTVTAPPRTLDAASSARNGAAEGGAAGGATAEQPLVTPQPRNLDAPGPNPPTGTEPDRGDDANLAASSPTTELDLVPRATAQELELALDVYKAAWQSLDFRAINAIHPSADVRKRDLRGIRTATVVFQDCDFDAQGDAATARCRSSLRIVRRDAGDDMQAFGGLRLVRDQGRWVVAERLP